MIDHRSSGSTQMQLQNKIHKASITFTLVVESGSALPDTCTMEVKRILSF